MYLFGVPNRKKNEKEFPNSGELICYVLKGEDESSQHPCLDQFETACSFVRLQL
jgi:hypothetical protein